MPAEVWNEAVQMTVSGALVAAGAGLAALVARAWKPKHESLLPRWRPWPVPWTGFAVTAAFVVIALVVPMLVSESLAAVGFFQAVYGPDFPTVKDTDTDQAKDAASLRLLWAGVVAFPVQVGIFAIAASAAYPRWWAAQWRTRGGIAGKVWLAVVAWAALTPVVMLVHATVTLVYSSLDMQPDMHALTRLGGASARDRALFVFQACVAAPVVEELLFRGVLLPWCIGRTKVPGAGLSPATGLRPWFVMFAVLAFAVSSGNPAAVAFAGLLVIGLVAVWRIRVGARRARGIYATAALFAVVHSAVWPSPIPLFLLGLGLGWLAARTNGILVPVLVHGLFNAVSVVFVLRGGV